MERYRLSALMKDVEMGGDIDVVIAADAQRALDAEREKVKRLSTCGTDHSTPWWQVKCEDLEEQLAALQAQLAQPIRVCQGCGRVGRDGWVTARYECDELHGSLQCPDCQCIDLEINTAKELAALCTQAQAQLVRWKEALGEWLWNCTNLLGDYHIKTVQDFNEEVNRRIAWLMEHLDHTLPPPMTDEERDRMRKLSEDNAALQADNECKDSLIETLQAQLRQVEGQSQQQAEEAVIVFAKYTTLRQLLEDVLHTFGYLRFHRVAGMDGLLYETHNKMSPERTVEACEKRIRATLAAQDAGKVSTSIIGKQVPPSQWDKNAEVRGDIS